MKRLLWTLNGLLLAGVLACATVAILVPVDVSGRRGGSGVGGSVELGMEEAPVEPLSSFAVIYERPLRKPLYDPAPVVEAAPPPKPKPKPTFTLIGTVVEPGFTYGMFRTNKGETKLVEIGESIGGAEVTAVTEAGATVLMDGESIEMTVKEKEGL